jgi:CBS domain-containing protein
MSVRELLNVPVTELDPRRAVTVESDITAKAAVSLMNEERIGALCVVDGGKVVGIFTERDVLTKVVGRDDLGELPLRDVMTEAPGTLPADAKASEALDMMVKGGYRHMPIVDGAGKLVGMISIRDLVEYLADL